MTDPRIIECAKSLLRDGYVWEHIGEDARQRAVKGARAVILKWLEQTASVEMGEAYLLIRMPRDPWAGEFLTSEAAIELYAAMGKQAAKEIKEP